MTDSQKRTAIAFESLRILASEIAVRRDYFYQDVFLDQQSYNSPSLYFKRDFLFKRGVWRGEFHGPIFDLGSSKQIFIGHSDLDFSLADWRRTRRVAGFRKIFATNLTVSPSLWNVLQTFPLPLGLSNPTRESPKHEILGNSEVIASISLAPPVKFFPRVYANFDVNTSLANRMSLYELIQRLPNVVKSETIHSEAGRFRYLREMRESGLVVCPAGNGRDTHRFYEALLVGSLPIVLRKSYQAKLSRLYRFPTVEIESWDELANAQRLTAKALVALEKPYSLDALRASFWIQKWRRFDDES